MPKTYLEEVQADRPLGFWRLAEVTSAQAAFDSSGNGRAGAYGGSGGSFRNSGPVADSPWSVDCASARRMQVDYLAALAPTVAITMEGWAFQSDWATYGATASEGAVISKTEAGGYLLSFMNGSVANRLTVLARRNGAYGAVHAAVIHLLSAGWHHFAGTFDGRFTRAYIDGVEVGTADDAGANYAIEYANNNHLQIGAEAGALNVAGTPNYYQSRLSNIAIYDTALSAARLLAHFNAALISSPDTVGSNYMPASKGPRRFFLGPPALTTLPRIDSVSPNSGRISGGTSVTISGANFFDGALVLFNGVQATNVVVVSPTEITCDTPANPAGLVDVSITVGPETGIAEDVFTYFATVLLARNISPSYGLLAGGTLVTLRGANFVTGCTITLAGVAATDVTFVDDQTYTCVSGASLNKGFGDVVMTSPAAEVTTVRNAWQYVERERGDTILTSCIRRNPGITIQDALNNSPNTASFVVYGANKPQCPERVKIIDSLDGDRKLFAGNVQSSEQFYGDGSGDGETHELSWRVHAIDFTWLFNRRRPYGLYENVPADEIVRDLVTKYAPGFTVNYVQTRLALISIFLDGSRDMSTVLTVIANAIGGGHWYIDYDQDVHFFRTIPPGVVVPAEPPGVMNTQSAPALTFALGASLEGVPTQTWFGIMMFWATTFIYENGAESRISLSSVPVRSDNTKELVFSNIPLGPVVGGKNCVGRRVYIFWYDKTPKWVCRYIINDNTTTGFTDSYKGNPDYDYLGQDPGFYRSVAELAAAMQGSKNTLTLVADFSPRIDAGVLTTLQASDEDIPTTRSLLGAVIGFSVLDSFLCGGKTNPGSAEEVYNIDRRYGAGTSSPPIPYVAPPAYGSTQKVKLTLSDIPMWVADDDFDQRVGGTTYGPQAVCIANVYADMTVSKAGPVTLRDYASTVNPPVLDYTPPFGTQSYGVPNYFTYSDIPIGQPVNGVPCIARLIIYVTNPGTTREGRYAHDVIDNTSTELTPIKYESYSFPLSKGGATTGAVTPIQNEDGPYLEQFDPPDVLNDTNTQLLRDTPITYNVDASQVRNKIHVTGASTSTSDEALEGETSVEIYDVTLLSRGTGKVFIRGRVYSYFGVSAETGIGTLFLNEPLATNVPQGTSVQLYLLVEDVESQKILGLLTRDKNGDPTDGVHEYTLNDTSLTDQFQLYMRGAAELELFAYPVGTLTYATRDPKTRSGARIVVDLSNPPITGEFLIQSVNIDQIRKESDDLAPRYSVTASSVKFTLNDLLLQIIQGNQSGTGGYGGSAGIANSVTNVTNNSTGGVFALDKRFGFSSAAIQSGGGVPIYVNAGLGSFSGTALSLQSSEQAAGNPPTVGDSSQFAWITTGASINNLAEAAGSSQIRLESNIDMRFVLRTPVNITNVMFWAGLIQSGLSIPTDEDGGGRAMCAFRYRAGQDGGWVGLISAVGAVSAYTTATIAAVAASTEYELRIYTTGHVNASVQNLTVNFQVNGGTVQSATYTQTRTASGSPQNSMPIVGTSGILLPMYGVVTKTNAARRIGFRSFAVLLDN